MAIQPGWEGRFYEDFEIGDVYRHPLGRTITEADNTWFSLLTMNTNQTHFNAHLAAEGPFGKPIVNSALTIAITLGQSVIDTSYNAFANLEIDDLQLVAPVFAGDTLYAESLVLDKRESASRPNAGIVHIKTRSLNQDATVIMRYRRKFIVYKRDAETGRIAFPIADPPIEAED